MNDKIDMVYLWCDGNDPEFLKRKRRYQLLEGRELTEWQGGENRFIDNDELKYSLRSLEKYASWINHVYIITDRQIPLWLNISYEKVTIVDHSDILPSDSIPCFNSSVIELFIPFIKQLTECFLYGNDDMFFGNYVQKEDFFNGGKPIVKVIERNRYRNIVDFRIFKDEIKKSDPNNVYLINAYELLYNQYNRYNPYVLHHNIDAYTKTSFCNTLSQFKDHFREMYSNRFRKENDIARIILGLNAVYKGEAILKVLKDPNIFQRYIPYLFKSSWRSYRGTEDRKTRDRIERFRPDLFCINAREDGNLREKRLMKEFYCRYFPDKSKFEK